MRAGAGGREVFPVRSGGQSNPAGLVSENEIGTQPGRMDLKSLMQPCVARDFVILWWTTAATGPMLAVPMDFVSQTNLTLKRRKG